MSNAIVANVAILGTDVLVGDGAVLGMLVGTDMMVADYMSKPLQGRKFRQFCEAILGA